MNTGPFPSTKRFSTGISTLVLLCRWGINTLYGEDVAALTSALAELHHRLSRW